MAITKSSFNTGANHDTWGFQTPILETLRQGINPQRLENPMELMVFKVTKGKEAGGVSEWGNGLDGVGSETPKAAIWGTIVRVAASWRGLAGGAGMAGIAVKLIN